MHRLALIAALAIPAPALPPPDPAHAGFLDAPRLQALCAAEGPDAAAGQALCLGYVTGVADGLLIPRARGRRTIVCPPADATPLAVVAAVRRQSRYAVAAAGVGAADFVRFALERAWPCPIERSRP
ncbi:Rap1a/Tai family immunity protein [Phenylobacterium sp.]|uniref:Rap1a/Tai family immunity protein n=1 Tax=Phenylobacterium sp. TaxID=1871053 RepID=UPI003BA869FC